MNLSAPFIRRPVMTIFLMITIILSGWVAFVKLPVSDLPTIEYPNIKVTAGYTGANSETVLNQITIPLEKELTNVKGVQEITSRSSPGQTTISLTFDLTKDMTESLSDVQRALNRAERHLPKDMDQHPTYSLQKDGQEPIMYLLLTSDSSNAGEMRNYADTYIIPRLSRVEGVAQVIAYGPEKSVWVRLNPELMAIRQIGFNQVIETIRRHTAQIPLGAIQTSSKTLEIELSGAIERSKDLANLKIGTSQVRLKDIGEISEDAEDETEFHLVTPDSSSLALILAIQKVTDANTVAISKSVQNVLSVLKNELPPAIHLNLWFDKAIWIEESIADVEWSILFAFALVVLVIYFSLGRFSEALITIIALPLSLVGTFVIMYLSDFSLNLLSLLALTLSVGFVVDDAIVVLENIVRHQEKGESPLEASLMGSKQICFTIVSMTLSLVAVFIPLFFMGGMNGRLFKEFSMTLAAAILVSGFISLTLTPMLCSRFLSKHSSPNTLQKKVTSMTEKWTARYGKTLKYCFRYPKTLFVFAICCTAAMVLLFSKLPVNLIPTEDRGFIFAHVSLPGGITSAETNDYQQRMETLIRNNPYLKDFLSINSSNGLMFLVRLNPLHQRPPQQEIIGEFQEALDAIPGIQAFMRGYQLINLDIDFGRAGQYKFIVRGLDFPGVEEATQTLTKAMQDNSEFTFVRNSLENDSPKLVVHVNEEQAQKIGFNKQHIQDLLQKAYGQGNIASIQQGAIQKQIFLELLPEYRNHIGALNHLYLTTSNGSIVPLKSVANWTQQMGSPNFTRREQLPAATIRFSLDDTIAPNVGLQQVEEMAKNILPANVSGVLDGSAKAISSTIRNTLLLLLAAAIVMYVTLGILYESFIHPLTILSSLPFAGLGGILTLFLFNEPISIFSAIGFLLLIGIVKKNGIMMIDYALEAKKQGMSSEQAIYEGCLVRFRPIMMTTIAAVMGAVPIAIGFGDGAEMRRGLGLVIVGGLLFSQILTLYITPILYLIFDKLSSKKNRCDTVTSSSS